MSIKILLVDKDDEANVSYIYEITELYHRVWPHLGNAFSKTQWAFGGSQSGIILLARDAMTDILVGVRGSMVWPIAFQGRTFNFHQFHGTCVHPGYRRLGIFSKLNEAFLKNFKESSGDGIFNVSVNASRKGYEKMGWVYISGVRRLFYFPNLLKPFLTGDVRSLVAHEFHLGIRSSDIFPRYEQVYDLLQEREKSLNMCIHTQYSASFYYWRYSDPLGGYQNVFMPSQYFCVYKEGTRGNLKEVLIGDIWLKDYSKEALQAVLKKIREKENPDLINTIVSASHPLYRLLRNCLFFPDPRRSLNFGVRKVNDVLDIDLTKKWSVAAADIDTF